MQFAGQEFLNDLRWHAGLVMGKNSRESEKILGTLRDQRHFVIRSETKCAPSDRPGDDWFSVATGEKSFSG